MKLICQVERRLDTASPGHRWWTPPGSALGPGAEMMCGLLVGGTGQNAQVPIGASPVNFP